MNHLLKLAALGLCLSALLPLAAQLSEYDLNAPFGWANCSSLSSGDSYTVTGGGNGSSVTLKSNGGDMKSAIADAIKKYSVVVLDGSAGDFTVSSIIELKNLQNKTIVGINGARLCTQWYVTDEIRQLLDDNNVKSLSTSSGTGGTLSNGSSIDEARELKTRQLIIDYTGDSKESHRKAGIFYVSGCTNFVVRNLAFVGPGPVDVGGYDLFTCINKTTHLWVDHCSFSDGLDGNFDITNESDFVTVSWCLFEYTDRAYDHMNTNLVGSSDSRTADEDKLNITFYANIWGTKCNARMPMARFGTIHLLNNYYNCPGAGNTVNPRKNSEFVIESNYWAKGVTKIFSQSGAKAWVWKGDNHFAENYTPSSQGSVSLPYAYQGFSAELVPEVLTAANGAGPTLSDPLKTGREDALTTPEAQSLHLTGKYVCGQGLIEIYSPTGIRVLRGTDRLSLESLPAGCWIVRCGSDCLKLVQK